MFDSVVYYSKILWSEIKAFAESTVFAAFSDDSNSYKNYGRQIEAIHKKYSNLADYGCSSVKTIINFRASATMSEKFNVTIKDGFAKEKAWLEEFIKINKLYGSKYIGYGRMGEKEGKVLINLRLIKKDDVVKIKLCALPYRTYKYIPHLDEDNELKYISYTNRPSTDDEIVVVNDMDEIKINPDRFVFVVLSGTEATSREDYIVTPPTIAGVLKYVDNADKALDNLRQVNFLFSSPVPFFETLNWADAVQMKKIIKGQNDRKAQESDDGHPKKFRFGKTGFAAPVKFSMISANLQGAEMLIKEITTNTQIVSGATGIPVFMMGFPDLIGQGRATAQEMTDSINVATETERTIWEESWLEIIQKACLLHNEYNNDKLNPDAFEKVTIPIVSMARMLKIKELYENAVIQGIVSKRTYYEKMDDLDPDIELERIGEEKKAAKEADNSMFNDNMDNLDKILNTDPKKKDPLNE